MKKVEFKEKVYDLDEKDAALVEVLKELTNELRKTRQNGR